MSNNGPIFPSPIDDFGNTHVGRCHICHEEGKNIAFCKYCQHWMCYDCRKKWWTRPWEAIKQAVKEATQGKDGECCGPN